MQHTKKWDTNSGTETLIKKNPLRNLTKFHSGLFKLVIIEIFTTAFLLKLLFKLEFFQVLQSALLRNEK